MPLIIDAYNVVQTTGVLPPELAGTDIAHLIGLLQSSRYRDEKITLACDGMPQLKAGESAKRQVGSITVRYAGKGKSADDLIAQLITASSAPRSLIVISSDHGVVRAARRRRCKTRSSEELLQDLAHDATAARGMASAPSIRKPPGGMSDAQVQKWMKMFNVDDRTIALESAATDDSPTSLTDDAARPATAAEPASPAPPAREVKEIRRGPVVPRSVIEQAERLWSQQRRSQARLDSGSAKSNDQQPDDEAQDHAEE